MDRTIIQRTEVAAMLATTDRHVRRLVESGKLRAVHVGGKQRFLRQDVDDFIDRSIEAAEVHRSAA